MVMYLGHIDIGIAIGLGLLRLNRHMIEYVTYLRYTAGDRDAQRRQ